MTELTPKQQRVFDELKLFIYEHQYPPTVRELAEALEMSKGGAYDHMKRLRRNGAIRFQEGVSRSIVILNQDQCVYCRDEQDADKG